MKRRFHADNLSLLSVESLDRYANLHLLAGLMNGDTHGDFGKLVNPGWPKSAEARRWGVGRVGGDNVLNKFAHCLCRGVCLGNPMVLHVTAIAAVSTKKREM